MLQVYTSVDQTVAENAPVNFNITKLSTCCCTTISNANQITLKKAGRYMVQFNGSASAATAGNVSVQLYSNGTKIADAVSSNYSGATGQDGSLHFATIIQVRPSCAMVDNAVNLQVINISGSATFSNANLIITKLG